MQPNNICAVSDSLFMAYLLLLLLLLLLGVIQFWNVDFALMKEKTSWVSKYVKAAATRRDVTMVQSHGG